MLWLTHGSLPFDRPAVAHLSFASQLAQPTMGMHIVEGWSAFGSPRDTVLSLLFVLFTYFGPGMIKSVLTLRTGNAWVHALGYHAVAPHVVADAPLVVRIFGIR